MHYVQKLLPTLDWKSGPLGVRLRYEPDEPIKCQQEYIAARTKAANTTAAAIKTAEGKGDAPQLELWPLNLVDFLDRRVRSFFKVKAYLLDPACRYGKCSHISLATTDQLAAPRHDLTSVQHRLRTSRAVPQARTGSRRNRDWQ